MDYAYKKEDKIVWPIAMLSRFNDTGAWHTLSDEERAKQNWYPISYTNKTYDPKLQVRTLSSSELKDSVFFVTYDIRDKTLAELTKHKEEIIRAEFEESILPVDKFNTQWNGGFDSVLAIDGFTRMTEESGATEVVIFDFHNQPHTLSIGEAKSLAIEIGTHYQLAFAAKQARMTSLGEVTINTPNIISVIDAI